MGNNQSMRRHSEFPPKRGQIKIKIFKNVFRSVVSMTEASARSRRGNEPLTSSSTTAAPTPSGYTSEAQSEPETTTSTATAAAAAAAFNSEAQSDPETAIAVSRLEARSESPPTHLGNFNS